MHYLIAGDYHLASRKFLTSLIDMGKKSGKEIIKINGEKTDLEEMTKASRSQSLFGDDKLLVIENLFSRRKSGIQDEILEYIKNYENDCQLIFWEKKSVGKVMQRKLPKGCQIKEFKTPVLIFKLVESLSPLNKKNSLSLLQQILDKESAELVMAMIARQIRLLIQIKGGEEIGGAPWMIGKLKKQASLFKLSNLLTSYEKLYIIDRQIKTGLTPMKLGFHLTKWMAEL